jgi:anti-sigma regulatory factor (Ser/Thr protein kinase)
MVASEPLLAVELPATPESVPKARHAAERIAAEFGADKDDVALAVTEAAANACCHAYRHGATGTIRLTVDLEEDQLVIAIRDQGVGMSPHPEWGGLGLGLPLIGRLSSGVHFDEVGTGVSIRMTFDTAA